MESLPLESVSLTGLGIEFGGRSGEPLMKSASTLASPLTTTAQSASVIGSCPMGWTHTRAAECQSDAAVGRGRDTFVGQGDAPGGHKFDFVPSAWALPRQPQPPLAPQRPQLRIPVGCWRGATRKGEAGD